ncbi:hypothetical protein KY285_000848 [Solanum tuberosum]|nr:hypothetical protein KY289_001031 [Solanum tuberosum]KAH0764977.1 hypothetical protein KY285_000848 [Solanum tuberosum]
MHNVIIFLIFTNLYSMGSYIHIRKRTSHGANLSNPISLALGKKQLLLLVLGKKQLLLLVLGKKQLLLLVQGKKLLRVDERIYCGLMGR